VEIFGLPVDNNKQARHKISQKYFLAIFVWLSVTKTLPHYSFCSCCSFSTWNTSEFYILLLHTITLSHKFYQKQFTMSCISHTHHEFVQEDIIAKFNPLLSLPPPTRVCTYQSYTVCVNRWSIQSIISERNFIKNKISHSNKSLLILSNSALIGCRS
jgi:hypothetical protein